MLSTDLSQLEGWFRAVLEGQRTPTAAQCLAFLDGLEDVQRQAFALEHAAVRENAQAPEQKDGGNIIVLPLMKGGDA